VTQSSCREASPVNLSSKVVLLLCGLFAVYGAADYVVQREVILPSFEALEADLARTDMERATRAIDSELTQLQTFGADWGNWLETYDYMAGNEPDFIVNNMNKPTIEGAGLELVAFVDADGRFVWRRGFDPDTHDELEFRMLTADSLATGHPFRDAIRNGEPAKGLIVTEHGPAMLVAAPILDGAGNGPQRGSVLLARLITPDVAARLAEQAQVRLQVSTLDGSAASTAAKDAVNSPRIVQRETTNEVYRDLPDIFGQPAVALRIDVPRSVSAQGRDAIGYALLSLFAAGVSVLLVLIVALRRLVLAPVSRMTQYAVAIGEGDDLTLRMVVKRPDELGVLAREFNGMVDKLADARRRLVDHSFEAGAAQAASGVLHNIGNAMTPVGVTVAGLQERLRGAPVGEVEMVLAELESGVSDPERKADLEQFLRLASRELTRVIANAGEDVESVARQAEVIQRTLVQEQRPSQASPVVESVRLTELVDRSVEMVAPALRQCLTVDLDSSVPGTEALRLPRITLQQVFQNLIQNAAESVRQAGREHGILRISCSVVTGAEGRHLLLRFTDDGIGIPPEHASRIFEKGFSTKSRETNFGIGLHWCANALNALGGSIRAESDGLAGATLQVVVPLREVSATAVAQAA
jgi:two-component system NtrC family sensor kinase